MSEAKYFRAEYTYITRPWYRKGRKTTQIEWFKAETLEAAMYMAKQFGEQRLSRHRWTVNVEYGHR